MVKKYIINISCITSLIICFFCFKLEANDFCYTDCDYQSWTGLKFNVNAGAFFVSRKINEDDHKRCGPCLELGLEYGWSFGPKKRWYFGADLLFSAFIPDSFEKSSITIINDDDAKTYAVFFPIIDLLLGFSITDKTQILIGSTYFWGLTAMVRHRISESYYFSFKTVYWADRDIFNKGIHDFYSTIGIGRIF